MMNLRSLFAPMLLAGLAMTSAVGCSAADTGEDDTSEEALTSLTARARTLKFTGYVYVDANASDQMILQTVRRQTQSAFGALRTSDIGVNSRELKDVDPSTFVKTKVTIVDPANPTVKTTMLRVVYTYTDAALVPVTMARLSTLKMGVLNGYYQSQTDRILKECTDGGKEAHEFVSSIWYVFEPSQASCKTAMSAEQQKIDADKRKIPTGTLPKSEVDRLYIPLTAALTAAKTNGAKSYPEYDRLYAGGVQKDKLVIGMVNGMMADWAAGETHDDIDDSGYDMWFEGIREIKNARPNLKYTKIEPAEDLTSYLVNGKTVKLPGGFEDALKIELDGTGYPAGLTNYTDRHALQVAIGKKLVRHWVTFQAPVSVKIGSGAEHTVTIEVNTYFGAETDSTPHKRAIKNSDVFVYNGHSYIGYGPLDPSRFTSSDFPSSYQIMFVNGCVSYNYYEKDYKPLKVGGTANLDLVSNGLESWVNGSGPAMGRFVGALIDGKLNSYKAILAEAQFTGYGYEWGQDALRVVDGELDNKWKPSVTPITVK